MRRHAGGGGAAPAVVPRKHGSGTPWVAVRPHYGGLPAFGLDGTGRTGRKPWDQAGEESAVRVPEVRPRGAKSPQWSAERRASGDPDAPPQGVDYKGAARRSAPSAFGRGQGLARWGEDQGAPGASKHPGPREAVSEKPQAGTASGRGPRTV
jgi:hypothetical protein